MNGLYLTPLPDASVMDLVWDIITQGEVLREMMDDRQRRAAEYREWYFAQAEKELANG